MELAYFANSNNVGDELNTLIWPALLGELLDNGDGNKLFGIGTLLNQRFCNHFAGKKNFVLGTGAGYGDKPKMDNSWHIYAVRGPRTAKSLGLDPKTAVADSAYLLATLDWQRGSPPTPSKKSIVVIPHYRTLSLLDWQRTCQDAGIQLLSPLTPPNRFMAELANADLVITEAMHGAILADIVRTPWIPFSLGGEFLEEKWCDWLDAFQTPLQLNRIKGFYDPAFVIPRQNLAQHARHWIKASAADYAIGPSRWKSVTPPALSVEKAYERLQKKLTELSQLNGQLTQQKIMDERVELLYERVSDLRKYFGLTSAQELTGTPGGLLDGTSDDPLAKNRAHY